MAGNWTGQGIISSAAADNATHLYTLGSILNNGGNGQAIYGSAAPLGLFDGFSPVVTDLLVRQTYVGDANLDGAVDASDYSRIDNGYLNHLTGWYNGDFNYDGVVNGSDYTLIDNAFNTQGSTAAASIESPAAAPTGQVATGTKSIPSAIRSAASSFTPAVFQSQTPIVFAASTDPSLELLMRRKDVVDSLET